MEQDVINFQMLLQCCQYLLSILRHTVNFCISSSTFSHAWKHVLVLLKLKINKPENYSHFWSFRIPSICLNILEKILSKQLMEQKFHYILQEVQSKFGMGFRYASEKCKIIDDVIVASDQSGLVILNVSKTFDNVNYELLVCVLWKGSSRRNVNCW